MADPQQPAGGAAAEPRAAEPLEPAEAPEKLTGASPVELIPRLELRHRFVEPEAGGALHTTVFRMDLVFFRRVLLRYELPHGTLSAMGTQTSGWGDIELRAITLLASTRRSVIAVIPGVVLDTATRPALGTGKQQVVFGGGAVFKPVPIWLMLGIVEQRLSFRGDPARPDVNQLTVRLGNIVFGRNLTWYELDLDTVIDFENDQTRLLGTVEVGRLLIGRLALFVRAGTTLAGQRQVDYYLDGGVRYLFKLDDAAARSGK
jgi:hypothetical protein